MLKQPAAKVEEYTESPCSKCFWGSPTRCNQYYLASPGHLLSKMQLLLHSLNRVAQASVIFFTSVVHTAPRNYNQLHCKSGDHVLDR